MRCKIISLLLICVVFITFSASAQRLHLMPPRTELLEQNKDDTGAIAIATYKYSSQSSKLDIIRFYRHMLLGEGFKEIESYSSLKGDDKLSFFFNKPGKMVMLNFFAQPQGGVSKYYIIVYESDAEQIKKYLQKIQNQ